MLMVQYCSNSSKTTTASFAIEVIMITASQHQRETREFIMTKIMMIRKNNEHDYSI